MQTKRTKRSRARAAKKTAGYGSKKKHRGSGHRGGFGRSNIGKRGSAKLMQITKGQKDYLGKYGFKSRAEKIRTINIQQIQDKLATFLKDGTMKREGEVFLIDLSSLGYSKLLSKGDLKIKLQVIVDSASENAISKIEAAGGKIELKEKSPSE